MEKNRDILQTVLASSCSSVIFKDSYTKLMKEKITKQWLFKTRYLCNYTWTAIYKLC